MSNNAKMIGSGRRETAKFVRDNQEPEDFYDFWLISETDAKSAVEIAPAEKFIFRPTLSDWLNIGKQSAFSLWHSPVLLSITCLVIGCLFGLILGYHAKP